MTRWLAEPIHRSWFIAWWGLGFVIGTAGCAFISSRLLLDNAWQIIGWAGALFCLLRQSRVMLAGIFLSASLIGLCRGSQLKEALSLYRPYYGKVVEVRARVGQDASTTEKGEQRLNLNDVKINGQYYKGEIWASAGKTPIKRGDEVVLRGVISEGFGNISGTMYRAQVLQIIRPSPGDIARRMRDWFAEGARKAIPESQVNLGLGYLVGQKTALPPHLDEEIKVVGLTHAVVASGYNLTILVMFSRRLFGGISKYVATLCSCLMVLSFMMVTGLSPSMCRAGLVACLGLIVWYYGRKVHPFVLLSFAASVTLLMNPSYIWGDLGWYLSFGSFIGVLVLAPLIHRYFWATREPSMLRSLIVETLSAQIITEPLILASFGLYSAYALPANILVLPLIPLAMAGTFLAGAAGLLAPSIAPVFGYPATLALSYSIKMITFWANLPNAQIEVKFNSGLMAGSYSLIGAVIAYLIWRTKYDFRKNIDEPVY